MEYIFLSVILLPHVYAYHECVPTVISDGTLTASKNEKEFTAVASCNKGYTLEPPHSVIICEHAGGSKYTWSPSLPSCITTAMHSSPRPSFELHTTTSVLQPTTYLTSTGLPHIRTSIIYTTTISVTPSGYSTGIPTLAPTTTLTYTPSTATHSSLRPSFESHTTTYELQPTNTLTSTGLPHITASITYTTTIPDFDVTPSGYSTGIPTLAPTTTLTYNSITAPTQTAPPVHQDDKGSDFNPAYIWAPVVACVVSITSVVLFLFWWKRKRTDKRKRSNDDINSHIYSNVNDQVDASFSSKTTPLKRTGYENSITAEIVSQSTDMFQPCKEPKRDNNKQSNIQAGVHRNEDDAEYLTPVYQTEYENTSFKLDDIKSSELGSGCHYESLQRNKMCENEYNSLRVNKENQV